MKLLGIDDAGRGPVIGPMILAGVLINPEQENHIKSLGAKDSKLLSRKKRLEIKSILEKTYQTKYEISTPKEIDDHINLNLLEAQKAAKIINHFSKQTKEKINVIIDCPSTNIQSWTNEVKKILSTVYHLPSTTYQLACEHKADFNHPIVSAASIIAKEIRESEIDKLKDQLKIDFGSGYPADPKTKNFLEKNHTKKEFSSIIRFSWNTVKKLQKPKQTKLFT